MPAWVPVVGRLERSARFRIADYRRRQQVTQVANQARDVGEHVFRRILTDDEFFHELA